MCVCVEGEVVWCVCVCVCVCVCACACMYECGCAHMHACISARKSVFVREREKKVKDKWLANIQLDCARARDGEVCGCKEVVKQH